MTLPALLLGFVLATLYGAAFHIWRNGGLLRLLLYLGLSWVGFWGGQFIASFQGWDFLKIGPLHLGLATLGSLLFLFVGHWLSKIEVERA